MLRADKQAWIAALRSGEYEQAVGKLRESTFTARPKCCCLGVLCEILEIPKTITLSYWFYDEEKFYLPRSVQMRTKLESKGVTIVLWDERDVDYQTTTLANLNDDGFTFSQIADVIDYFVEATDA